MPEPPDDVSAAYQEALISFIDCLAHGLGDATGEQLKILAMQAAMRLRDQEGQEAVERMFEEAKVIMDTVIARREKEAAEKGKK